MFSIIAIVLCINMHAGDRMQLSSDLIDRKQTKRFGDSLHKALKKKEDDQIQKLLDDGAHVNEFYGGFYPIHFADERWIDALVVRGASISSIDKRFGATPLHIACVKNMQSLAKKLIKLGASIDARDHHGYSPLHYAAIKDSKDVTDVLLAHIKGLSNSSYHIDARNHYNVTPLMISLKQGSLLVALRLMQAGASVNSQNELGSTPLHYAIAADVFGTQVARMAFINELLQCDAHVQIVDSYNNTSLHIAASKGLLTVVKLLVSYCDINAVNKSNHTSLALARKMGHKEVVDYLIEQGAHDVS